MKTPPVGILNWAPVSTYANWSRWSDPIVYTQTQCEKIAKTLRLSPVRGLALSDGNLFSHWLRSSAHSTRLLRSFSVRHRNSIQESIEAYLARWGLPPTRGRATITKSLVPSLPYLVDTSFVHPSTMIMITRLNSQLAGFVWLSNFWAHRPRVDPHQHQLRSFTLIC